MAVKGEYRFLCDADLSMPITEIFKFLPPMLDNYDIAIGSREAQGAHRYDEPPHRHFMGRIFNWLVRLVAVRGLKDTQCGFKCFTGQAAEALFPLQTIDGFAFDAELLFLAQRRRLRVVEVAIEWYFDSHSKVHPIRDTVNMFRGAVAIRWNYWRGRYG